MAHSQCWRIIILRRWWPPRRLHRVNLRTSNPWSFLLLLLHSRRLGLSKIAELRSPKIRLFADQSTRWSYLMPRRPRPSLYPHPKLLSPSFHSKPSSSSSLSPWIKKTRSCERSRLASTGEDSCPYQLLLMHLGNHSFLASNPASNLLTKRCSRWALARVPMSSITSNANNRPCQFRSQSMRSQRTPKLTRSLRSLVYLSGSMRNLLKTWLIIIWISLICARWAWKKLFILQNNKYLVTPYRWVWGMSKTCMTARVHGGGGSSWIHALAWSLMAK